MLRAAFSRVERRSQLTRPSSLKVVMRVCVEVLGGGFEDEVEVA